MDTRAQWRRSSGIALAAAALIAGFARPAEARVETLRWTHAQAADVDGFRVHYGTSPGSYTTTVDVGKPAASSGVYSHDLTVGDSATIYVALSAYGSGFLDSFQSNERMLSPTSTSPPTSPTPTLSSLDIGGVGAGGSYSVSSGTHTVRGSGADIWGSADEFQFAYTTLTGNGEIRARVLTQTNTDPWAKAGVMVRDSLAANAKHALMAMTPGNGAVFHYRETTGGGTQPLAQGHSVSLPRWVRIVRAGNLLSGYHSADGVSWTLRDSRTIAMGATVYLGLAVTSHQDGTLGTATFDGVAVSASTGPPQPPVLVP